VTANTVASPSAASWRCVTSGAMWAWQSSPACFDLKETRAQHNSVPKCHSDVFYMCLGQAPTRRNRQRLAVFRARQARGCFRGVSPNSQAFASGSLRGPANSRLLDAGGRRGSSAVSDRTSAAALKLLCSQPDGPGCTVHPFVTVTILPRASATGKTQCGNGIPSFDG
jgi:hypothetical protein